MTYCHFPIFKLSFIGGHLHEAFVNLYMDIEVKILVRSNQWLMKYSHLNSEVMFHRKSSSNPKKTEKVAGKPSLRVHVRALILCA